MNRIEQNLEIYKTLKRMNIEKFTPAQDKALNAGLMSGRNLLICTPTSSGKTLIGVMAALNNIFNRSGKVLYIVPLKALASEKYRDFTRELAGIKVALSIGETDSADPYLINYDFIIMTSEKLDSLLRHRAEWISKVNCIIIDEIHLLNDPGRGPTLEIIITLLRRIIKDLQIIGLSATIGNPKELAEWLNAELVLDSWRPVKLSKGIYLEGEIEFFEDA